MTPAEATLWLIASPFIIIGGGAILAIAIRAFSPEAQVQLYAPVKSWAGAHPLVFRTLLVFGGWALARIAGGVLSLVATIAVAVWLVVLIIRYWREPWVIPTLERAADLAIRFWAWFSAWRKGELFQWAIGRRRTAEVAAEAESVQRALAMDTPEADLQLAAQRHAFAQQIDALSALSVRDYHQEMQLAHLGRMIKDIDAGRFGPTLVSRPMAELGEVGQRRGFLAALSGGPMQWIAVAGVAFGLTGWGAAAVQGARLDHAKSDLSEARASIDGLSATLESRTAERDILASNIIEASQGAQEAAETINHERARNAAARRRERELVREIQERTADVGEPPTWSLRDDASGDPAGPGDRASGDPGVVSR